MKDKAYNVWHKIQKNWTNYRQECSDPWRYSKKEAEEILLYLTMGKEETPWILLEMDDNNNPIFGPSKDAPDHIRVIFDGGLHKIAMNMFIEECLKPIVKKYFTDDSLCMELNPQLYIKDVCEQVAQKVSQVVGMTCTTNDVMMYWLIQAIHFGHLIDPELLKAKPEASAKEQEHG